MNPHRILIAGLGNIFLGDDAFGVEVVRLLARRALPPEVKVVDFGIRGIDLTYALLEDYQQVILVDAIQRGESPGTLFVMEPATADISAEAMKTHDMAPRQALASARAMGAKMENILIVGCEPETFGTEAEPQMGLSAAVLASVPAAADMIESLIGETLKAVHA